MRRMMSGLMVAVMVAAVPGLSAQDATFEWQQRMSAGDVLEVQGIVGEIRAEYTSGSQVEVVAEKHGDSDDFSEVEIRVEEVRGGYLVCAIYNVSRARGDGCDVDHDRDGWRNRNRSIDVEVEYTVRVPAGVEFEGTMVSGDIVAEDLRSVVEATTVNGDIFVSTTERAHGGTVSGSIEIEMGSTDWSELDFNTVSGDITLWLPEGIDTDVDFESLSGDIDSDFDITSTRSRSRRWIGEELEGYIGSSGRRSLSFNTVSGDVRLRRARS